MSEIDKMTVISTDGATALTWSVAANVAQGIQLGTDLTGVDLPKLLARLGGTTEDSEAGNGRPTPRRAGSGVIEGPAQK